MLMMQVLHPFRRWRIPRPPVDCGRWATPGILCLAFFLLYSRHASFCPVILFLNSEDIHATALPGWKTFYTTCSMLPSALWKKGHNQRLHWLCVIFPHNRELIQETRHTDLRSLLFSFMAKSSLGHKRATQYFQDQE